MATREIEFSKPLSCPPDPAFSGDLTKVNIVELLGVGGVNPAPNIIRKDQNWQVEVNWYIESWLLSLPGISLNWEWVITVCLDAMGVGTDYTLPAGGYKVLMANHKTVDPTTPGKWEFEGIFQIPAGAVEIGVYKTVVTLTCQDVVTKTPLPMAGFLEIPGLVQFYKV